MADNTPRYADFESDAHDARDERPMRDQRMLVAVTLMIPFAAIFIALIIQGLGWLP